MSETPELPKPDSDELSGLLGVSTQRLLYGFLYRRRANPPTMVELRMFAADALGEDRSQTDRRVRELRRYFQIDTLHEDGQHVYVLAGWTHRRPTGADVPISRRRRSEVLAPQRCAQCGRTPLEDCIKLDVDHKIPQSWGGNNDFENLQPLCQDCNAGKRDYFESFEEHAERIRQAITHDEPQRRIGELLKAFNGGWVRTDLLALVASAGEYQEDWQRRLRDLRFLGWEIEHQKRYNEGARVWTYYRASKTAKWPDNIRTAITAEEARRKKAKRTLPPSG